MLSPQRDIAIPVRLGFDYTGAQTATALWTPTAGMRFNVSSIALAGLCPAAAGQIIVFQGTDSAANWVLVASHASSEVLHLFYAYPRPIRGALDAVLRLTNTQAINPFRVIVCGYESA